ncbi:HNH endonuclease [Bradyrhizobium diazoefficiens]|nr:HNH endonuclease [Bradyrhizobium diazoefficiens]QQN66753.1 HNH endonuclease [Bradyrhizobium diazoefficiens]
METCIFCDNQLTKDTKPEHILLNALGGRKTTTKVDCSACNSDFGSTIDKEVGEQVTILRNMLQLDSGTGRGPPMLRKIPSGSDLLNITNDGRPELVAKPFTIRDLGDGQFQLNITAKSPEEMARWIPDIAASLGLTEDQVLKIIEGSQTTYTARRPDTVHHQLSFGGPLALRSITKSCLVLWATLVGNAEVKSTAYEAARRFVLDGDETFNTTRIFLDSRYLPRADELMQRFGPFFNLIYVKSNDAGRVVAHFTLYNIIGWQIVLAERGGTPNQRTALISNPLDPAKWSDTLADEIDIDFAWLVSPDYSDNFVRVKERLTAVMRHHVETEGPRELNRIADEVFAKHGVTNPDQPVSDPEILKKIEGDMRHRFGLHALSLPYVEHLSGKDIVARVRDALSKRDRP